MMDGIQQAVETKESLIIKSIRNIIEMIGDNPQRDGLLETPYRVCRAYSELFSGYQQDPADVLKTFENDCGCDQIVLLKDVEFFSTCEHHVLPFYGKAHIAYIPNSKYIVGISKLARVLDIYAKRLQVQERICQQVVQALRQYLNPLGAACIIEAKHLCIACRGVEKQHSVMVTSALDGLFLNDSSAKEELMRLIR